MGTLGFEIEKGIYLGIDFGTTNTVVSIYDYDSDTVTTLPLDGQQIMPTVIQFEEDYEHEGKLNAIFGTEAKEGAVIFPDSTVMSVKRLLGREQPIKVLVADRQYDFRPEDIVAKILEHIKGLAGKWLSEEMAVSGDFSGCVLTVPANSTDKQKHRMREAAVRAGFMEDLVFLRLEPAAAAISYAKSADKNNRVLVYDYGGGTFDACLLEMKAMDQEEPEISILSTYGDNYLGGDDIDRLMMDIIYDAFLEQTDHAIDLYNLTADDGVSARQKKIAQLRLKQAANQAKERLSTTESTKVVLAPFLQEPTIININLEITRDAFVHHARVHQLDSSDEFYEMMRGATLIDLVGRTISCVSKCIESAGIAVTEVDQVFLVGGSSALPEVKKQVAAYFGHDPYQSVVSPALSISQGAAHYCHMILLPSMAGPKILDKVIHPLGLEISGRRFLEIVEAGTEIPEEGLVVRASEPLYTSHDGLDSIAIVIYENTLPETGPKHLKFVHEEGMKRLAGTSLKGIPEGPQGEEKIEITFRVNRDNLLTVSASSLSTDGVSTELSVDDLYR